MVVSSSRSRTTIGAARADRARAAGAAHREPL
jgi:hypothetical protein